MFASIFFFIFLFFLFLIIIGGSLLRGILNLLFGRRTTRQQPYGHGARQQSGPQSSRSEQPASNSKKREKIFDASEGEYVDFEEIP